MNEPWECPRCFRINAPFNPTCFCKPEDEGYLIQHPKDDKASEHVMDAANYLGTLGQAEFKPMELPADLPYGYKKIYPPCS